MLYTLVEMNKAAMAPLRLHAKAAHSIWTSPTNPFRESQFGRSISAATSVFERATRYYGKPEWQIPTTEINGRTLEVTPRTVWASPSTTMLSNTLSPANSKRPWML